MTKKVFDVRRPGKAPASPTSRPVITGHKPPVADDQFVPTPTKSADDADERALMDANQKITLTPVTEHESPPTPAPEVADSQPPQTTPQQVDEPKPTPEHIAIEQVVETPTEPTPAVPQSQQPEPVDPLLAPIEDETLLDNTGAPVVGQAVISHHKKHRTKAWEWMVIVLLMVLLAAVAVNFLLDAGVIRPGFDIPHTNVLSN